MRQLIVSCSLSPKSSSALVAKQLARDVADVGDDVELLDLREIELPFCDAGACYGHPNVAKLKEAISSAAAVTIATPIYNYGVGGATRNLIALTGDSWTEKVVGFACAAGGQGSFMAVMNIANSLMLDFRAFVIPRFVYVTGQAFDESRTSLVDQDALDRIKQLAAELNRVGTALGAAS